MPPQAAAVVDTVTNVAKKDDRTLMIGAGIVLLLVMGYLLRLFIFELKKMMAEQREDAKAALAHQTAQTEKLIQVVTRCDSTIGNCQDAIEKAGSLISDCSLQLKENSMFFRRAADGKFREVGVIS